MQEEYELDLNNKKLKRWKKTNLESAISSAEDPDVMEVEPWQKLMVGDKVTHKSFGVGTIVSVDNKEMSVQFVNKTSRFFIPDAFEKGYLTL